ncbi:MAG: bifunctional nuclease family protein [Nitrospiraceae bacterium]|nr:bifunctional nuclease family protein [Nitrospiraceae bacterium]
MEQNGLKELTKLTVHGVVADPSTETQIVILRDERTAQVLPIWVGPAEGLAIQQAMDDTPTKRPMSHDLLCSMMEHLSLAVSRVVVTDVKNNMYFASVHLTSQGTERTVDARPSDAIALALRTNSPIFVTANVLQQRGGNSLDTWLEQLGTKSTSAGE